MLTANLSTDRKTFVTHLECSLTGERYEADRLHGLSAAGRPLLVRYDLAGINEALDRDELSARPTDLWRWRELLPVRHTASIVSLGEIETPLVAIPRSGGANVIVKDEGRLPTGSFKARGLVMAVVMAKELGVTKIAMPTNGNAGAALAAYASRAGIETVIFCPDDTPEINVREIAMQGARVYRVNGLIDECGAIVGKGAAEGLWFDFSTLKEPYRIEGKKTMGLELAAQLGWRLPRAIFYPTGGGTGLIGMWKAFAELEDLGWIGPERPKMFAVQASGCAPIVKAFEEGAEHGEALEVMTAGSGERQRLPRAILGEIIEARMSELLEMAREAMGDHRLPAGVILTGGGSMLPGVIELAQDIFQLPVRLGHPINLAGWGEQVETPQFSTGVGLLRFGLRQREAVGNPTIGSETTPVLHSAQVLNEQARRIWSQPAPAAFSPLPVNNDNGAFVENGNGTAPLPANVPDNGASDAGNTPFDQAPAAPTPIQVGGTDSSAVASPVVVKADDEPQESWWSKLLLKLRQLVGFVESS